MTDERDDTLMPEDEEARLDELQAEIGETRGGLTETVQAIGDRLEPSNLAREAGETVRSATIGKVDQMSNGAQQTWGDIRSGNPTNIIDTIRANPLPAGMVAAGIAMLLMKRGSSSSSSMSQTRDRRFNDSGSYGYQSGAYGSANGGGQSPVDKLGDAASDAGDKVGKAVDDLTGNVSRVAGDVGEQGSQMARQGSQMARQRASQVQHAFTSNPVGFGIAAVATGAALGLLLPSTPVERQALGPARDKLVDQAEDMVHETLDKVDEQTAVSSGT